MKWQVGKRRWKWFDVMCVWQVSIEHLSSSEIWCIFNELYMCMGAHMCLCVVHLCFRAVLILWRIKFWFILGSHWIFVFDLKRWKEIFQLVFLIIWALVIFSSMSSPIGYRSLGPKLTLEQEKIKLPHRAENVFHLILYQKGKNWVIWEWPLFS